MAQLITSVLDLIGGTPLLALSHVIEPGSARLLAKLESRNPSGSVKDRIALAVVENAERQGLVSASSILIWATSGNSGVALAMVAAAKGYRLTIFMPSNAPLNLRRLVERYGAEVRLTSPNLGMQGATEAATTYAASSPDSLLLDIFNDAQVVQAHYQNTAQEIIEAADCEVDAFVAAVGTGGTITGVGRRLKEVNPRVRIIAVEPAGSPVLSSGLAGRHMIPGIGADFVPPLLDRNLLDGITQVTDEEAGQMCRRLAREEGLLVGISSGANVFAALNIARELGPGRVVVTVLPDIGERYVDFSL
ncbi:MAG TPA: cysteine synthase A [Dehalococcoidia bacterium]|nr:cysteine synthase A [Dehalococcoidia bacterium]